MSIFGPPPFFLASRNGEEEKAAFCCCCCACARHPRAVQGRVSPLHSGEKVLRRADEGAFIVVVDVVALISFLSVAT